MIPFDPLSFVGRPPVGLDELRTTVRHLEEVWRAGEGNPNHKGSGPGGGQFTSGPGGGGAASKPHGKHWAKRQRRKAKKLEKLRKEGHEKFGKLREKHKAERKSLREKHKAGGDKAAQAKERQSLREKHRGERQEALKEHVAKVHLEVGKPNPENAKVKDLKETQARATRNIDKAIAKESAEFRKSAVQRHAAQKQERTDLRQWSKDVRVEIRKDYNERDQQIRKDASDNWQSERQFLRQQHADGALTKEEYHAKTTEWHKDYTERARKELREARAQYGEEITNHKEEFQDAWAKMDRAHRRDEISWQKSEVNMIKGWRQMRRDVLTEYKDKLKGQSAGRSIDELLRNRQDDGEVYRSGMSLGRMSKTKLHKASSAESILKHCLRQRGLSSRWREGQLTGQQHLTLLEDVRQYGRAWLRHEMGGFFEHYDATRNLDNQFNSRMLLGSSGDAEEREVSPQDDLLVTRGANEREILARNLASRLLSPLRRTFDRMRQFVRELTHAAGMAIAGPDLSMDDYTFLDGQADKQVDYLEAFRREMEANPPVEIATPQPIGMPSQVILVQEPPRSPAQVIARAELYGNAAWQAGQKLNRRKAGTGSYERRVLGQPKTEHCSDCPPLAALGWQPVGTLPDIGDSECGGLCLCHFEYSNNPTAPGATKVPGKPGNTRPKGVGAPVVVAPIKANPTNEEIDAEFKKWVAGKPSKIAVKDKPPRWSTEQEEKEFMLPEGYEWSSE